MKTRTYQIKEVADVAGVTTRALRYYDQIGLLTPSMRSTADYRLYTDADLLRLQQILIGRSLGLALEDIRKTIDDPSVDYKMLLQQQREVLVERAHETARMIRSIDAAVALLDSPPTQEISNVDMKQIFDGFDPAQYESEVQQRWGTTDAYKESARRTRQYTENDWRGIKQESNDILQDAIALLHANAKPEALEAMEIAERYRLWVDRWFYPCYRSMQINLADMYQGDPRFSKYFEDLAIGLAPFLSAAIHANSQQDRNVQKLID